MVEEGAGEVINYNLGSLGESEDIGDFLLLGGGGREHLMNIYTGRYGADITIIDYNNNFLLELLNRS